MSSYFYIYQGGAIASKLMVLDDVTGGNCWNAGYISTYKVRFGSNILTKDAEIVTGFR